MRTIAALVSILLFTVLALGLAYGTLANLKERMNNPYTNWVDVPVTISIEPKVDEILNYFRKSDQLKQYNLADITRYDVYYVPFLHKNQKDTFNLRGRTVDADERILQSILKDVKGNVIVQHSTLKDSPCGIIVTEEFLSTLGYSGKITNTLKISMPHIHQKILIDIIAVVKELPSLCDFISGPILPNMRNLSVEETGSIDLSVSNVVPIVIDHKLAESELQHILTAFKNLNISKLTEREKIAINQDEEHYIYQLIFPIEQVLESNEISEILQTLEIGSYVFLYKELNCNDKFSQIPKPDNFAFQFNDLEKIREFKDGMQQKFQVNVSMQQVESAENFSLVSALTLTTSVVLFAFALLCIGFYISSLIRSHLQKIASNLGTMKAFGLKNIILTRVYISIIGIFCIVSSLIALILAIAIQLITQKMNFNFHLNVLNGKVILALVVIVLLCLYLAYRSAKIILDNTPGDLIYKRNN